MTSAACAPNAARLGGALLLSFTFGSIHDFGVLLRPLEQTLDVSRLLVSLGYSLAIVFLTLGVLAAPLILSRFTPSRTALIAGIVGSAGLLIAAFSSNVFSFIAGYGVMFGFSNGVAYALFLQQAAQAVPARPSLGLGIATATYGLGMAAFAPVINWIISGGGPSYALLSLSGFVFLSAFGSAAAFVGQDTSRSDGLSQRALSNNTRLWRLWLIYVFAVSGCLMVVSHGEAIVSTAVNGPMMGQWAPSCFAIGNILGSLVGGAWADNRGLRPALAPPIILLGVSLLLLNFNAIPIYQLALMAMIGMSYGAIIVAIPAIIRNSVAEESFPQAFGLVFTAWGMAGLLGPSLGSAFNQLSSRYDQAILVAVTFCALAAFLTFITPRLAAQPMRSQK